MRKILFAILASTLVGTNALSTILNTKHNLSATGPGPIKAVNEQEVCVFCHIPHNAQPGKPLWNRSMPTTSYIMYESEYLKRTNYPLPADLGISEGTPGSLSRQCLSCHDGTVAIGSIYMVRGTILGNTLIDMIGVGTDGMMPVNTEGFIGTDLSVHHPVGIEYDPTNLINFDVGSKDIELKTTPDTPLKLFTYNGKKYVECSSCHDPHIDNKKFLRVNSGINHGDNVKKTCMGCHDKNGATPGAHQTATNLYTDTTVKNLYNNGGGVSVADLYCVNCHTPHNGQGKPYLLRKVEQNSCYSGAADTASTAPCHGTASTLPSNKQIEGFVSKIYSHPVNDINSEGVHTNLDTLYGVGSTNVDPAGSGSIRWDTSKHVECVDCHNPHKAQTGTHVAPNEWYPQNPTNLVSNTLKGVSGVEPIWPQSWTQPTSFQTLAESTKEYQICLKCHSYWALGPTLSSDPLEIATGATNNLLSNHVNVYATDQAFEFNPNNKSAHPVVVPLEQMPGSYAPKGLGSWGVNDVMFAPWNNNLGHQTMYCSDCHGAENEDTGDPKGPHGSTIKYMLKGPNKYWPVKPDGTLFTTDDIDWATGKATDLFCANCHNLKYPHEQWRNKMGNKAFACVECHVAVPHGSPVSRLIGYTNFPEPYNYNHNGVPQLKIKGYRKAQPTPWSISAANVYAPSCGGGGCHRRQAYPYVDNGVGYDPVTPLP